MSTNTALITDAAETAARQALSDYSAGVFAHTTGDWGKHNVVRVHAQPFIDSASHTTTVNTLRILATAGIADVALAVPINPTGSSVLLTSPPLITVQPASRNFPIGTLGRFTVGAISDTPMAYQWLKSGVAIEGQTSSQIVFPSVAATDVGSYTVVVSNAYGSVTSSAAALTTATASTRSNDDDGFDFLSVVLPPHIPF